LSDFLKSGSLLSWLVIINVGIWILSLLFPLVDYLYALPSGTVKGGWYGWMALSSRWHELLVHPWTIVTYMFLHDGLWHVLFNMLMLYFGGTLFCRYLGTRRFGWVYFLSGVAGAVLYLVVYNLFPVERFQVSTLVGASAAVLGVFVAVAAYVPEQDVSFWLIRTFTVKMKWVAVALVVIDLLTIPVGNAGGHIAHIGGALFGLLYVVAMRRLPNLMSDMSSPRRKKRTSNKQNNSRPLSDEEYNRRRHEEQKRVDEILDKISKYGYERLTKEEKEILFKQSK